MTLDDLPSWEHWMMPGNRWHELDAPYYPKPSPEDVSRMSAGARREVAAGEAGEWPDPRHRLVIADTDTDRLMGLVTSAWESEETNWLLIGIVLYDPATWGGDPATRRWGSGVTICSRQCRSLRASSALSRRHDSGGRGS
jgi:hypothetical protein